jgi:fructose-1,6-bisphosphatase/inositol monophosphatase family enzyme
MEKYLEFAKETARGAGEITRKYFYGENGAGYKYDQTIVTKADTEINSYLIERVREAFPTHAVDGEEEQFGASEYVWVCDPVDGTAMYARHIPVSVFSLALVKDGKPIVGVIYDSFTDNMYYACLGGGAYKNGERINVSTLPFSGMRTIVNIDAWPDAEYNLWEVYRELGKVTYTVGLGSIIRAAACVASGDFAAAIYPGTKHKNCDIAAAKVIVEEAGGKVTDLFGGEQRYDGDINGALISNGTVHAEALEIIKKHVIINK